jgi:predicted ATPase/DNA-binding SARP family transcriptional activator/Tfp pilus assembly protein PilF
MPESSSALAGHDTPVTPLDIRLFGPLEVRVCGRPLGRLRSRKGLLLLALLALRNGRNVDRDWLAGVLWPDCDERHSRINLRQSLHDLRAALGSESWRLSSDEPRTLRLDIRDARVDALEFDAILEGGSQEALATAVALYRGPLLEDCSEDWAVEGREQREQGVLRALESLVADATDRQDHAVAMERARAALRIDPFREDLLRALMVALAAEGNSAAALVSYREYRALLGRELMGEPDEATSALFRRLRDESRGATPRGPGRRRQAVEPEAGRRHARRTLPVPLTPLLGRDDEIRSVVSHFESSRLITLTGAGGIGKTRLAIQAATELGADFPDGVVFVDLAPILDRDLVADAVRAACGAESTESDQVAQETLCRHLSSRRVLLVLDNCEHLEPSCGALASSLLLQCPDLKILATSRQVLGIKGETVRRVPSLPAPQTDSSRSISVRHVQRQSTYLEFAAVKLFVDRARAAESSLEITPKNLVAIVMIAGRLDGIPLAIELASARVKSMSVERIAERLNDRFRILLGRSDLRSGEPIPRHQTLTASIDWSYDLLSPSEQALLRRVAVFVGGWSLEAAEAVCTGEPVLEWEVLDLLTALVEKSLVVYQPEEDRYRLLETIRQYLLQLPAEDESVAAVAARHLEHFLSLSETAQPELTGPRQLDWLDRLESDHDNIRAALAWSRSGQCDPELGLRLVSAMWLFWQTRGFIAEGRAHISLALAVGEAPTVNRAVALNAAGILAYRQTDYRGARTYYEQSLEIRRSLGDRGGIASCLNNLGIIIMEQGDFDGAQPYYEECLAICTEIGHQKGTAACLQNLGSIQLNQGNFDGAAEMYGRSLSIRRELGDSAGIARSLTNLGDVADVRKDHAAAGSLYQESLELRRELGDRLGIAHSLTGVGKSALALGDHLKARTALLEGLAIMNEAGHRTGIVVLLELFADLAAAGLDDSAELELRAKAPRLFGAAEAQREALGYPLAAIEQEDYQDRLQRAKSIMDLNAFDSAWADGRKLTLDESVELALRM